MSNSRFPVMAVALVVIGLGQVATADTTPAEEEKIETLIRTIETLKDAVFMRNGREYESAQAADHLRTKWRFARSRIKTARAFIIHVAARSSRTGEPYLIRSFARLSPRARRGFTACLRSSGRRCGSSTSTTPTRP